MTHICVSKLTIISSDNDLSPGRRQVIIWTNAGILLTGPLGRNFSEILIEIGTFSFKKLHLKVSSAKRRPFCLGLNVLNMHVSVLLCFSCNSVHVDFTHILQGYFTGTRGNQSFDCPQCQWSNPAEYGLIPCPGASECFRLAKAPSWIHRVPGCLITMHGCYARQQHFPDVTADNCCM